MCKCIAINATAATVHLASDLPALPCSLHFGISPGDPTLAILDHLQNTPLNLHCMKIIWKIFSKICKLPQHSFKDGQIHMILLYVCTGACRGNKSQHFLLKVCNSDNCHASCFFSWLHPARPGFELHASACMCVAHATNGNPHSCVCRSSSLGLTMH